MKLIEDELRDASEYCGGWALLRKAAETIEALRSENAKLLCGGSTVQSPATDDGVEDEGRWADNGGR